VTCPSHGFIQIAGDKVEKTIKLPLDRFNSISLTPPQTGIKFTGNITAGGTLSKGNTDSEAANASAKMESKVKNHRLNLGLKHNYGKTSGKLNARYTSCNIKYDYFLSKKLYNYAQSLFEQDAMQDLNLRSIYGIGAGYQILDTKRKKVFLETGISYLDEDYDESDDRHTTSGRWSFGFKYEAIPDRIKIFHLHEGYYSLEESNSYYIRSEQGVRLPLIAYFSANFEIDYNYNSRPAPGKKKSDTIYIIGLSYDFEF
jgi:putative salt-induced outer membrane protein YdiY